MAVRRGAGQASPARRLPARPAEPRALICSAPLPLPAPAAAPPPSWVQEQKLRPGETIDMPVFFYIDPEFASDPKMKGINTITLRWGPNGGALGGGVGAQRGWVGG